MTGGGNVETPQPSAAEIALQQQQAANLAQQNDIIQQQFQLQQQLLPILFQEAGLTPQLDEDGNIIGFTKEEDPNAETRDELETGFLERSLAALRGELPENPALLRDLAEQEKVLKEGLRKNLGRDFATDSAGIEALGKFDERKEILLDASRRDDLSTSEALGIGRQAANDANLQFFLNSITGINSGSLNTVSALGQLAGNQAQAIQGFQQNTAFRLSARTASAANSAGSSGALIGAGGGIAAAGLAAIII